MLSNAAGSRRLRTRGGLALVAWGALATMAAARQGTPERLAELVPDTTPVYIELTDASGLLARVMAPEYRSIVADIEALAEPDARKKWGEAVAAATFVASQLGTKPEKLIQELAGGGGALAVTGKDQVSGWFESRDADLLRRTHDVVLNLARQDAKQKGGQGPKTSEHAGVTIYQFDDKLAHAVVGSRLIFATSKESLEGILDRAKSGVGGFASLARSASFQRREKERVAGAWGWAYLDLETLRAADPNMFKGKPEDEAGTRLIFGPWIEALRAGKCASFTLGPDGTGVAARLDVDRSKSSSTAAYAGYAPPAGEGPAPLLKPAGTLLSVSLYRDMEAVWDARADLFPPEAQAGLAQLDTFAGQFFGGRDFATGVLGSLTPRWRVVVVEQDHEAIKPTPGTRLPGFAVVLGLKPDDEEFAVRLQSAFQSFVGLVNLGAAEQKAPPLMLGSVDVDGVAVSSASYMAPKGAADGDADIRFNFSPSAARVGNAFVIASSVQTAKSLVPLLKAEADATNPHAGVTLMAEGDGPEAAKLIGLNVGALRMNRMLEKGKDREAAEADVAAMGRLVKALGRVKLEIRDTPETVRVDLEAGK